jgi:hypothetical protein
MKQQTAVEFLLNEFEKVHKDFGGIDLEWLKRFDKALELEKQQIIDAFKSGDCNGTFETISGKQYFEEKFVN